MARPANIIPPTKLKLALPLDLRTRLDLYLFSQTEQRVPVGAYQRFIEPLIRARLDEIEAAQHAMLAQTSAD